ncbi:hypothetical protein D6T63_17645 [Arthrobacter cheniae]|uniref:Uncharacterized protein n=1 Tax=Arthrobacter cheniae TaxID=1258888 RepID=A0A3A5M9L2_9MICC|nr:hypothetical protein D6T63_17645 [Arthrobacter cheniae]
MCERPSDSPLIRFGNHLIDAFERGLLKRLRLIYVQQDRKNEAANFRVTKARLRSDLVSQSHSL